MTIETRTSTSISSEDITERQTDKSIVKYIFVYQNTLQQKFEKTNLNKKLLSPKTFQTNRGTQTYEVASL